MAFDVTVVIPNWNGAGQLGKALASLRAQTLPPAQIVVVDNGSTDDSRSVAKEMGAAVLALGRNHGFCHAVNLGVRAADTEWVVVLNNDVVLEQSWLEALSANIGRERPWFVAGRLLRQDDPQRLDGSFDLLSRAACAWRAGHGRTDTPAWQNPEAIAFPSFTAGLFQRTLFNHVGLLDERFGSYLEDVEFGLRCARAGFQGRYVPDAVALHQGGATLGAWSPAMVRLLARNQVYLLALHFPEGWFERFGGRVILGQCLWGLLAARRGVLGSWLRGKLEGIRRYGELRAGAQPWPVSQFDEFMAASEARILELQRRDGFDWYWKNYFRFCGEVV
jgi:GT2 family glycosyltransferase